MNRRNFTKLCGLGATVLVLNPWRFSRATELPAASSATSLPSQMLTLDLGGTAWTLQQSGQTEKISAQVPGEHYSDLLRAGKIPDPYYRDNNMAVQWAAKAGWTYQRTFEATPEQLAMKHVELVCHGLDTLATVKLNGTTLGSTNNMFRTWVFDVQKALKPGANDLQIEFQPLPNDAEVKSWNEAYVTQHPNVDHPGGKHHSYPAKGWIRKAPYQWGWDLCKPILTMGIWKSIELRAYDSRLAILAVQQHHNPDGSVRLDLSAGLAGMPPSGCQLSARLLEEGSPVKQPIAPVGTVTALSLTVAQPKLWWPNGIGDQNLYTVELQLLDAGGNVLDTMRKRIGLRQFEAVMGTKQLPFTMKVNGQPFFAKGADWVPPDNLLARITPEVWRQYMQDGAACNFNFMRLWGGGFYEDDALFDACDELGIVLLFEFKFAGVSGYPSFDPQFMANVAAELDDQIVRIRHHPSIAIWSGNNELRDFVGYKELFHDLIGGKVRQLVPGEYYQVSSGGSGAHDSHDWGVWHGNKPFSAYAGDHGFVSEFGFQSYLEPASTRSFATEADLMAGVTSPILQFHECSWHGRIENLLLYYFGKIPANIDDVFWLSQIVQAYGIRFGVEHWRRDWPHSTAALVWQYNDSWPGQTWSMTDYYHRWKALQYHARHMFAPMLVSGEVDAALGKVDIHVINDRLTGGKASLSWRLATTEGKVLRHKETTIDLPASGTMVADSVVLTDTEKAAELPNLLLWMTVTPEGGSAETNISFFALPGQLTLPTPLIQAKVTGAGKRFSVTLESAQPALWTWINLAKDPDARYSDNFVHLEPGTPVSINVDCGQEHSAEDFQGQLAVRSVREFITPGIALPLVPPTSSSSPKPQPAPATSTVGTGR